MKIYQETRREGERMGAIDYSYDFRLRYENYCISPENRQQRCDADVSRLHEVENRFKTGELLQVCVRDYWHNLIDVGMYDGWPYWSPTPAVFTSGVLGGEWHFWYDISAIRLQPQGTK